MTKQEVIDLIEEKENIQKRILEYFDLGFNCSEYNHVMEVFLNKDTKWFKSEIDYGGNRQKTIAQFYQYSENSWTNYSVGVAKETDNFMVSYLDDPEGNLVGITLFPKDNEVESYDDLPTREEYDKIKLASN